ncbi:MAG: DUF4097 family beta strand repeat-containing protein [Clostridium sp.]|uniref:DUF4097 family beta strand repeat-containing protein n=1 Tax=Clostridium sp. TaxID=1506 RepID=UPI003D6CE77B
MNKKVVIAIVITIVILLIIGLFFKKERKNYEVDASSIHNIIVNDKVNEVRVKKSNDHKIHVTYSEGKGLSYDISENHGKLRISSANKFMNISLSLNIYDNSLIIEIPEDYNKGINIFAEDKCTVDESIKFSSKNIKSEYED